MNNYHLRGETCSPGVRFLINDVQRPGFNLKAFSGALLV